jgi:hypothetical protein
MTEQAFFHGLLVTSLETLDMCVLFLFRKVRTDREAPRGTRARYTLIGECSSFLVQFKMTHF